MNLFGYLFRKHSPRAHESLRLFHRHGRITAATRLSGLLLVAGLWLIFLWSHAAAALTDSKADELHAKIADINLLQEQLNERLQQIESLRGELMQRKKELVDEILVLKKNMGIDTFLKSQQQPRVRNNIELLRLIAGVNKEYDNKWAFYQSGCNRLSYLRQSAQDDIHMIATLNNLKIDALTTQISLVINTYLPEAHIMQIDFNNVVLPSAQSVWDDMFGVKIK